AYQPIPAIARVYVFLLPSVKSPLVKSTEAILRSSTAGKRRSKMIAYLVGKRWSLSENCVLCDTLQPLREIRATVAAHKRAALKLNIDILTAEVKS
ncbi:hypothetical protein, partial [Alteromonas sp.]|uniref:hypothetical protein n=1 Tax=Alteromonas sp. TaxID=232 RepID=UPI00257D6205